MDTSQGGGQGRRRGGDAGRRAGTAGLCPTQPLRNLVTLSLWGLRPQFPIIPALPEPGKAANSQTHKILETYLLGTWQWNEITNFFFSLIFWPCHVASGILVSQQGVEPTSPALEAQRLNHWMTREVPRAPILNNIIMIVRRCSIPGIELNLENLALKA